MPHITNITQYFDITVNKFPTHTAIIDDGQTFTMEFLQQKALNVAHGISTKLNAKINTIIAVYLPKSIHTIICDIAILYSGNAYMNLNIKSPEQRTINILEHVSPTLIITSQNYTENFKKTDIPILFIENLESIHCSKASQEKLSHIRNKVINTDPLCIINTSGSTGTPKAVVLTHLGFIDYAQWAINAELIKDKEIVGSLAPTIFDHFSFELCLLMIKSTTLLIIPDTMAAFPIRMLQLLQQHKVTFIFWVPTIMVNIANMKLLDEIDLPDLKMIWFAGEVFPTSKCNYWRKYISQATFVNLYGPTEITVDCTYHVLTREYDDAEPIPIGKACHNTGILLLNDEDKEAKCGEDAELCVRGSSLAMGYYNDAEKTAKAFVQNPCNNKYPELIYRTGDIVYINNDGDIIYKGRKDTLIKHQGYRIELSELEHIVINTLQLVKNCAVLYNAPAKAITVFYEAAEKLNEKEMRSKISQNVPRYMVPTVYIHYKELPRNINGKIDRQRLKNDSFAR